jgi:hypothetical protein
MIGFSAKVLTYPLIALITRANMKTPSWTPVIFEANAKRQPTSRSSVIGLVGSFWLNRFI